jgi:hypothetical protein
MFGFAPKSIDRAHPRPIAHPLAGPRFLGQAGHPRAVCGYGEAQGHAFQPAATQAHAKIAPSVAKSSRKSCRKFGMT